MTPTVAVVGASPAGLSTARALRARSREGRIVVVGGERHARHDRRPLSEGSLARVQFAGSRRADDEMRVAEGSRADRSVLAVYARDGRAVAVLGVDQPGQSTRRRRQLRTSVPTGA